MPLDLSGDIAGLGKIVQIVRATDTTIRTTTSSSPVDVPGMSVTITPIKSDSIVIVIASFLQDTTASGNDNRGNYRITDSNNNSVLAAATVGDYVGSALIQSVQTMIGYALPATTSPVTYKLRFNTLNSASARVLNNSMPGQMYAIEVSS